MKDVAFGLVLVVAVMVGFWVVIDLNDRWNDREDAKIKRARQIMTEELQKMGR